MKKLISTFVIAAFVAMIAFNVSLNLANNSKTNLTMVNIEVLANCESPVETKKGREAIMHCPMPGGGTYDLKGCDFDNGYSVLCTGRCAGCE